MTPAWVVTEDDPEGMFTRGQFVTEQQRVGYCIPVRAATIDELLENLDWSYLRLRFDGYRCVGCDRTMVAGDTVYALQRPNHERKRRRCYGCFVEHIQEHAA